MNLTCFVQHILEDDDNETIKDILGDDYLAPERPEEPGGVPGEVDRNGRWADIKIGGDYHFCISYLTPVAVYISGEGVKMTDKYWSSSTQRHIVKWAKHIGMGFRNMADMRERCAVIPQQELLDLFKQMAETVQWTKRQSKQAQRVPETPYGLISGSDERIDVRPPYRE